VSYVIAIVCAIAVYRQNAAQRQDTFKLPANEEQNPVYQTETAEWLNLFLSRVWCMLSPSMLTGVADMLEDALLQSMPSIMTAVQIEDFQLGPKAPIISDVKVYPGPTLDTVVLECGIFLKPSSPDNQKEGFHMILNAFVGIPQVGKVAIPIMVQEAGFHGKLRMKLTLVSDPPFLSFGQFQFISPPKVGVGILPLRMVNVMDLPWLSGYIKAAIDAAIGSVMVEPNALELNLTQLLTGDDTLHDTMAKSVMRIKIHSATNIGDLTREKAPDPYVTLSLGSAPTKILAKTSVKHNSLDPVWEEEFFIPVRKEDKELAWQIWDWDRTTKDDLMTKGTIDLHGSVQGKHVQDGRLTISSQLCKKIDGHDDHVSGILSILIHQALEITMHPKDSASASNPLAKAAHSASVSPYCTLYVNDEEKFETRAKPHTSNPYWNAGTEIFIRDWKATNVRLEVKDQRDSELDVVIGIVELKLQDLFNDNENRHSAWFPMSPIIGAGKIRVSFVFRAVDLGLNEQQRGYEVGMLQLSNFRIRNPPQKHNYRLSFRTRPHTLSAQTATAHVKDDTVKWEEERITFPISKRYQTTLAGDLTVSSIGLLKSASHSHPFTLDLKQLIDDKLVQHTFCFSQQASSKSEETLSPSEPVGDEFKAEPPVLDDLQVHDSLILSFDVAFRKGLPCWTMEGNSELGSAPWESVLSVIDSSNKEHHQALDIDKLVTKSQKASKYMIGDLSKTTTDLVTGGRLPHGRGRRISRWWVHEVGRRSSRLQVWKTRYDNNQVKIESELS